MKQIELPALYGDIIYMYSYGLENKCIECRVTKITINRQGIHYKLWEEPHGKARECDSEAFGKYVFLERL